MPRTSHEVRGIFAPFNHPHMKFLVAIGLAAFALIGAFTGLTDRGEALSPRTDPTKAAARGEKLAQLLCLPCHADGENRLTGRRMTDVPKLFGKIYSTNITQDSTVGIGRWSDGELTHFLRTGTRPDGSLAPAMPRYPLMADEDLQAVVAYLRSDAYPVQATATEAPKTRYSLPVKLLANSIFKPLPYPTSPIAPPDTTDEVALGRYLADGVIGCYGCHSADFKKLDPLHPERSKGYYGGGNRLLGDGGKPVFSANLTFDDETGIGKTHSREQFIRAVKLGVKHDGTALRAPMPPHPALTDREAGAIYAYLKTVPKLRNAVRR